MAEVIFEPVRLNPAPVPSLSQPGSPSPQPHSEGWTYRPPRPLRHKCGCLDIPATAAKGAVGQLQAVSDSAVDGGPGRVALQCLGADCKPTSSPFRVFQPPLNLPRGSKAHCQQQKLGHPEPVLPCPSEAEWDHRARAQGPAMSPRSAGFMQAGSGLG